MVERSDVVSRREDREPEPVGGGLKKFNSDSMPCFASVERSAVVVPPVRAQAHRERAIEDDHDVELLRRAVAPTARAPLGGHVQVVETEDLPEEGRHLGAGLKVDLARAGRTTGGRGGAALLWIGRVEGAGGEAVDRRVGAVAALLPVGVQERLRVSRRGARARQLLRPCQQREVDGGLEAALLKVCVAEVDGDRGAAHEDDHAERDDHRDDAALFAQPGDHGVPAGHWIRTCAEVVMFGSPAVIPNTFNWSGYVTVIVTVVPEGHSGVVFAGAGLKEYWSLLVSISESRFWASRPSTSWIALASFVEAARRRPASLVPDSRSMSVQNQLPTSMTPIRSSMRTGSRIANSTSACPRS